MISRIKVICIITLAISYGSCKKGTTLAGNSASNFKGKYNGPMLQNGPGSFKNYKTGPLTFEVFEPNGSKFSLQFSANQFIADAELNGKNFRIIPKSIEYGGTRMDISGFGFFKTDSMYIAWTQKQYSFNNYLDSMQFKGMLKKL